MTTASEHEDRISTYRVNASIRLLRDDTTALIAANAAPEDAASLVLANVGRYLIALSRTQMLSPLLAGLGQTLIDATRDREET